MDNNVLVITLIFDAPIETLWKYWTEPEYYKQWWGPKDFTCPESSIDFRVGGKYLHCMRGAPAPGAPVQDFWSTGTYIEIIPVKKFVVTDSFADKDGNVVPSSHYGMPEFPMEMQITVEFEEMNGKTQMTLSHVGVGNADEDMKKNMGQGWNQSFDKLSNVIHS